MLSNTSDRQYKIIAFSANIFEVTRKASGRWLKIQVALKTQAQNIPLIATWVSCEIVSVHVCVNQFLVVTSMVCLLQWTKRNILL